MKVVRAIAGLCLLPTIVLLGCASDNESQAGGDAADSQDDPIVIGMPAERTGPTATPSSLGADGVVLAVEELNDAGGVLGRSIELVEIDTEGDGARAVQAIRELDDLGAAAVVGPVSGSLCAAVAPTLNEVEVPGICLSPADLPADDDFMFGMGVELAQINQESWEYMAEANGSVGILVPSTPVGELLEGHIESLASEDIELATQTIADDDTTARPQIQALLDQEVGGLFIAHCGPVSITAAREAIDLGFDGKILLYNCFASETAAESIKGFTNGNVETFAPQFLLGTNAEDDPQTPSIEAFESAGGKPDIVMAVGWDGMMLIAQAIEAAGSAEPGDIVEALEDDFRFAGVWSANAITADDHRGARTEGALIPARFTTEGTLIAVEE